VGASPSANYAHVPYRNWRADYEMPEEAKGVCKDIARQLVEDNLDIQVILGGGRQYFYPQSHADPEYPDKYGKRLDGRNLVEVSILYSIFYVEVSIYSIFYVEVSIYSIFYVEVSIYSIFYVEVSIYSILYVEVSIYRL